LAFFWEGDNSVCFVELEADDEDAAGGDGLRRFEGPEAILDDDRFVPGEDGRCRWFS